MTENHKYLESLFNRLFEYQPNIEALRSEHLPCSFTTSEPNGEGKIIGIICRGQEDFSNITIPKELNQLEYLNLCDNNNFTTLYFDGAFSKLKHFDCSDSKITYLDFPAGFDALEYCDASRNEIDEFNFNGNMPALIFLELSGNKIRELYFRHECEQLKYLYCIDSQLGSINFDFPMPELEILHLRGNQLEDLPQILSQFDSLKELYLHGNSMSKIAARVLGQGENHNSVEEVLAYLGATTKSAIKYLHEAKMVLVGNGEVGKSSIRIKLLDETAPLPKKEERTPGLDISTYTIKSFYPPMPIDLESDSPPQQQFNAPINFDLNIWDFGGQGKYREIQQLFCSPKTLYLFVTACDDKPTNEDYVGFEYWLSMVNAYSFDTGAEQSSPVIHVVNKIDIAEYAINQKDIQGIFPNIKNFVQISCQELTNFDTLRDTILNILPDVNKQIFTEPFTENWLNVKDILKTKEPENHITFDEYLEICNENDLSRKEAQAWLKVLDRIGTVIYFGTDPELKDWVILNPIWVKQALYLALDSPLINNATITDNLFPFIWQDATEEEHKKLIALMVACKLCYLNTNNMGEKEYIVPSLLKSEIPAFPNHLTAPDFEIRFNFDPFIPAGTVNKLMVNLHQKIYNNFKWKNNVIFHNPQSNSYAHVCENWEEKCIEINLFGRDVKSIYDLIHQNLTEINTNLKNARFIQKLNFEVKGKRKDKWREISILQELEANEFSFLWGKQQDLFQNINANDMEMIKKLIGDAKLERALKLLLEQVPEDFKNEVRGYQSQLADLGKRERIGIISFSEGNTAKNKITHSVLNLISAAEKSSVATDASEVNSPSEPPSTSTQPKIYFSYAWGDPKEKEKSREDIVNKLYDSLVKGKFNVQRDKMDLGYGGLISKFMTDIGEGDLIVVFISDKYVRSPYCMFELNEIARNSKMNKNDFAKRVLPVPVEYIDFAKPSVLNQYFKYWETEEEEWSDLIKSRPGQIKPANFDRFNKTKDINHNLGELLDWLADMNQMTADLLSENDFEKVKETILSRLKKA